MHVLLKKDAKFPPQELKPFWKDFALKLGFNNDSITTIGENFNEEDRLKAVFSIWYNQDQYQLKYPFTWKGLDNLLEACSS